MTAQPEPGRALDWILREADWQECDQTYRSADVDAARADLAALREALREARVYVARVAFSELEEQDAAFAFLPRLDRLLSAPTAPNPDPENAR